MIVNNWKLSWKHLVQTQHYSVLRMRLQLQVLIWSFSKRFSWDTWFKRLMCILLLAFSFILMYFFFLLASENLVLVVFNWSSEISQICTRVQEIYSSKNCHLSNQNSRENWTNFETKKKLPLRDQKIFIIFERWLLFRVFTKMEDSYLISRYVAIFLYLS